MEDRQFDAVLDNETNLLWNSRDPKMPGYILHRMERQDGNSRGTAIYVRKRLNTLLLTSPISDNWKQRQ